jgi:hypothetical protein
MTQRRLLASLAAVAAFGALGVVGQAAGGGSFAADFGVVEPCTDAGVRADLEVDASVVRAVTVGDLPAQCLGQDLDVTLGGSTYDVTVSGPVTGTSTRLVLASPVAAHDVQTIAVLLTS